VRPISADASDLAVAQSWPLRVREHPRAASWSRSIHPLFEYEVPAVFVLQLLQTYSFSFFVEHYLCYRSHSHTAYTVIAIARMASLMALPPSVLTAVFLLLPSLATAQNDNAKECSCFRTNETSAGYFTSHRFFDFRNVASAPSVTPAIVSDLPNLTNSYYSSDYFTEDAWKNDWTIQNWTSSDSMVTSGATVLMANSLSNVYIGMSCPHSASHNADPTRKKRRRRPLLRLAPNPSYLSPSRLPISCRIRLRRTKLSIPLRSVYGTSHWISRCLRRNVHIPFK
jgi:hypothetical protein